MYYPEYPTPLFLKICFSLLDNSIYILLTLMVILLMLKIIIETRFIQKFLYFLRFRKK